MRTGTRGRTPRTASRLAAMGVLALTATSLTAMAGTSVAQEPPGPAAAVPVHYEAPIYYFSTGDVTADYSGLTRAEDPSIIDEGTTFTAKDGSVLYGIDSAFGFLEYDFWGAVELERDGEYTEGYAGNVGSEAEPAGIIVADVPTDTFKAGYPRGTWLTGLGGNMVKASSEFYVVMEHVLTCAQTVPYDYWATYEYWAAGEPSSANPVDPYGVPITCETLAAIDPAEIAMLEPNETSILHDIAVGEDYSVTRKDDGKLLYRWGTAVKRPTDIRFRATIPLPDEWKSVPEGTPGYRVLNATLAIDHTISNNSNDQIRPEDWENEAASGLLPGYAESGGMWTSTRDCYEGDGDYIPAGTTFLDPLYADSSALSEDLLLGHTNAWYTTIHRDPFAWAYDTGSGIVGSHDPDPSLGEVVSGPRWRLTAPKFGQNLPSLEIPVETCTLPPYQKGELRYEVGTRVTTTLNLLDWDTAPDFDVWPDLDEYSPFAYSAGWTTPMDEFEDVRCATTTADGDCVTDLGTRLTDDFDLVMYVKGDQKPVYVYSALLSIDYVVDEPYDFGDAPATYGTLLADGGAQHFIAAPNADSTEVALMLGSTIDAEFDGQPTPDASGDVDDGITFVTPLVPGETATIQAAHTASAELTGTPYLYGWVDFDASGTFDADELVISTLAGDPAGQEFTFDVPADAVAGPTFARFRLTTAGTLGPTGLAVDGEVEDYAVTIGDAPVVMDYEDVAGLVADGSVVAALSDGTNLSGAAALGTFGTGMTDLMVGDVTGDGEDDVVAREAATGAWYVLGHPTAWAAAPAGGGGGGTLTLIDVALGDVTGDGTADALAIADTGQLYVGVSDGDSFTFAIAQEFMQAGIAKLLAGDVDGDGDDDVIALLSTNELMVGLSDAGAIAAPVSWGTAESRFGWGYVDVGDVNGDGLADVFLHQNRSPKLSAAVSDGTTFTMTQLGTFSLGNMTMATTADINGDGMTDFVGFRVTANGVPESSVALSSGTYITVQDLGPVPGLTGAVEVAGGELG